MSYNPYEPTYRYENPGRYERPGRGHRNPQDILKDMRTVRQTINPKDDPSVALIVEFLEAMDAHQMVLYQP